MEEVAARVLREIDEAVYVSMTSQILRMALQFRARRFICLDLLHHDLSPLEDRFEIHKPVCVS